MRTWLGVTALAVGIFVLITVEELPIGVLSVMAPDLGVSEGVAGLAVTVPGVLAALVAMSTPLLVRGLDRRLVLIIALLSVVISCALSIVAPSFGWLLLARLFAGVSIGLYWAVLPIVAMGQVEPHRVSAALTLAFSGTGGALVLGVPAAAWIGSHVGWRASFAVVGAVAALVAVAILLLVRPVHSRQAVTLSMMRTALTTRAVRYVLAFTGLGVVGQFATYSYVSPLLVQRAQVPLRDLGLLLLLFGIAGLIGNFAVGPLIRRSAPGAVLVVIGGTLAALLAVLVLVHSPGAAMIVMPLWGLCVGAVSVSVQAFITAEAPEVLEEGTALNSAMFNVSIAVGALIGGLVLDAAGMEPMVLTSVVLLAAAVALALRYLRRPAPHGAAELPAG
ncbi:MFS transporter [Brachybacterium sp. Marseille-Q7125]|uniref:MFS transporter n=1 Tax=Brachybacterium sp. Marseille-Q7125 TaxID=2932815 RepID=UPI001FF66B45|nr:MFS transporter [Brachybacterium sp. Marseille-Q7125]